VTPDPRTVAHEAGHAIAAHALFGPIATGIEWKCGGTIAAEYGFIDPLKAGGANAATAFAAAVLAVAGDAAVARLMPEDPPTAPEGSDRERIAEAYAFAGGPPHAPTFRRYLAAAWAAAHHLLAAHHDDLVTLAAELDGGRDLPIDYLHPVQAAGRRLSEVKARVLELDDGPVVDAVSGFMRPDPIARYGTPPSLWGAA
jgi:hypothetical protein